MRRGVCHRSLLSLLLAIGAKKNIVQQVKKTKLWFCCTSHDRQPANYCTSQGIGGEPGCGSGSRPSAVAAQFVDSYSTVLSPPP